MSRFDLRLLSRAEEKIFGEVQPTPNVTHYRVESQRFALSAGLVPLVQAVISNLLTTPGTDRLNPQRGGGLLQLMRRLRRRDPSVRAQIASRIRDVETFMLEEQRQRQMTPQERLREIRIIEIREYIDNIERVDIVLEVVADDASSYYILV